MGVTVGCVKPLRHVAGAVLFVLGLAAIVYGGLVASVVEIDGDAWWEPHGFEGWLICVAGVGLGLLGAKVFGADMDWRERG